MKFPAQLLLPSLIWAGAACGQSPPRPVDPDESKLNDSTLASSVARVPLDIDPKADEKSRYTTLSDHDFQVVAKDLGVEVAAIKAVVLIEAGRKMEGFYAPGVPVVNFDRSMYNIYAKKAKNTKGDKGAKVPGGLSGYALKEWTELTNARKQNRDGADMGTFWGMFQIGGFNYKLCGCKDVNEMVDAMCASELAQLELFARFLINTGYVNDLRAKNWAGFARKYNGPSYAKRGYHTKMASAYRRFKAQEK